MTRKEKVFNCLQALCDQVTLDDLEGGFSGFQASEVGQKADISRNNASAELNALTAEKRIVKIKGRPVYFFTRERLEELLSIKLEDRVFEVDSINYFLERKNDSKNAIKVEEKSFEKLIGANGSLDLPIKQAKAAILYPPRGLHTLLVGSTGVGKTTFAEMMYNFAVESGTIDSDAEFVIFNCSEYANNPQLLLSQLFGHKKGAFTGADTDKAGLVEKSNGGVLLLDEIHRLPPEGQEMLFLLMDKNIYRRLGETENTRKANVLLIGATTEDVNSNLLQTFLRRIPMVIKLPDLSEKPLIERLQLIKQFFLDEAKCVQVPIRVSKDVIKAFLLYDCNGNIGQLKSDIQLTCARGFLDYRTYDKDRIEIHTSLLHDYIYKGLLKRGYNNQEIMDLIGRDNSNYYEFTPFDEGFTMLGEYDISEDLYKIIKEKHIEYSKQGYSKQKINQMLNVYIEEYIKRLIKRFDIVRGIPKDEELFKIVSPKVYYAMELALNLVEQKFKKRYNKKVLIGLCMHICALMERSYEGKTLDYPQLNDIVLNNPVELNAARLIKEILEEELGISIPKEEIGIIAMFLSSVNADLGESEGAIGVIVLAHGKSTASSIADTVNSLLGTKHCKAIDMPLDCKVEEVLDKTINMVKSIVQGKGVLLMVDMGSLVAFAEIVTKKTGIETKSVEMVSTPMVLEAVRKAMLPEMTLNQLCEDIQNVGPYIGRVLTKDIKNKVLIDEPKTIITTCLTGQGSAIKLVQFINNALPIIKDYNVNLVPLNYDQDTKLNGIETKNLIAVVGTVDLKIPDVPYIPIDEVIIGDGLKTLEKLITGQELGNYNKPSEYSIIGVLEETLAFLNPIKAYEIIRNVFIKIINELGLVNNDRMRIGFLFHTCTMVERVLTGESLTYNNIQRLIQAKPQLYKVIKNNLQEIEEKFGIEIPDTEIGYIMDFFDAQ
ncbi:sigma 54-interacting transcriptional regulator [Tepidimicrobium xylanilyticum]